MFGTLFLSSFGRYPISKIKKLIKYTTDRHVEHALISSMQKLRYEIFTKTLLTKDPQHLFQKKDLNKRKYIIEFRSSIETIGDKEIVISATSNDRKSQNLRMFADEMKLKFDRNVELIKDIQIG